MKDIGNDMVVKKDIYIVYPQTYTIYRLGKVDTITLSKENIEALAEYVKDDK